MDYSFLLAKTPHIKLFILTFGRIIILSFLFVCSPFFLHGDKDATARLLAVAAPVREALQG
jgi:hypothetical protein